MSHFFKVENLFHCLNTSWLAGMFLPHVQYLFWCSKTFCAVAAYRYTCTYNMLYSLSYMECSVMTDCEILLNSSLLLHSFSSQEQESYSPALIVECSCHDDGGRKNCSNACAPISVHLSSTSCQQQPSQSPQWLLQAFQSHTFKLFDFWRWFVTVLYFQHYEFYLLPWWVHILNSFVVDCSFSWRYNKLWLYFHSPVAGFSLLVFEDSWSHTTKRHSR
jgi:hypothetical protein